MLEKVIVTARETEESLKDVPSAVSAINADSMKGMEVQARACGHDALGRFNKDDLATFSREMAFLSGIKYSGFSDLEKLL